MTKEEKRALIEKAQQQDREALALLFKQHEDLIWSVVHRFKALGGDMDDLYSVGTYGLVKAIQNFDFSFDTTLTTYAMPLIIGEIKAYIRGLTPVKVSRQVKLNSYKIANKRDDLLKALGREPTLSELAQATELDVEQVVMALNAPSMTASLDFSDGDDLPLFEKIADTSGGTTDTTLALKEAVRGIGKKEQTLLYLRYDVGLSQSEVAKRLDMNQVAVSRLEKKILNNLRERMS